MLPTQPNYRLSRDGNYTNSSSQSRLVIPNINLSGPPSSIIPNGFPGGILYDTVSSKPYYSDGKGWHLLSGGGGSVGSVTDSFIFYDPTTVATGGGWGATGPSSNLSITSTDPQVTTPTAVWSTMFNGGGNVTIDNATGTFTIVNSGLYKVSITLSLFATAPAMPGTLILLLYADTAPALTYFSTITLSSNVAGFNPTGTFSQTSTRMWPAGYQLPMKFNWFCIGVGTFIFSPLYISFERLGDYNPVPPYP